MWDSAFSLENDFVTCRDRLWDSERMRYEIVAVEILLKLEMARFRDRMRDRLVLGASDILSRARDRLEHSDLWLKEIFEDAVEVKIELDQLTGARDRSRDSQVLVLRLCDSLVLGLLGIDFEMVKDDRVEVAAEQVV